MPKICFVIGPIGDVGSSVRAEADDFMKYIVGPCEALQDFGYGPPVRADQLSEPGRITSQVVKLLMEADLVIADLTGNNANVFYELSLRHAIGKPVIHMAADGTSLSFDVRDNRTIFYTMHSRVAEAARDELAKQIRHVHSKGYKPMNPILETVSIVSLERSSDPNQNALGQVMRILESLDGEMKSIRSTMNRMQNEQELAQLLQRHSTSFPVGGSGGSLYPAGVTGGSSLGSLLNPTGVAGTPYPAAVSGILSEALGLPPHTTLTSSADTPLAARIDPAKPKSPEKKR